MGKKNSDAVYFEQLRIAETVNNLTLRVDKLVSERDRRYIEQLSDMSKFRKEIIGMIDDLYETINLKDEMDSLSKLIVAAGEEMDRSADYYDYLQEDYGYLNELRNEKTSKLNTILEGKK
jgi:hypothetical protein